MTVSHFYWHVVVKNGNFTLLLTSSGQECQFLVGLSFQFIEMKELCEARAKLEMSSNLADEPTLANVLPPIWNCLMKKWQLCVSILSMRTLLKQSFDEKVTGDVLPPCKTASENDLTLCVSILSMRTHLKQSFDEKLTGDVLPPPFETARVQSDLFTVQCCQWEPIWNSQLIRKYKKIPVHI